MKQNLNAQLVVAEKVIFDQTQKKHDIHKILNKVEVPIFPSALITDVYIKIIFPESDRRLRASVQVSSEDDTLLAYSETFELKNFREEGHYPGVDTFVNLRFPVVEEGTHWYRLFIDEQLYQEYPLFVYTTEKGETSGLSK